MGKQPQQEPVEVELTALSSSRANGSNTSSTLQLNTPPAQPLQDEDQFAKLSTSRAVTVSCAVAGIAFISSMTTGLLATGLPKIAANVNLSDALILWPASIFGLTGGCTFIPIASIADAVGSRYVHLFGCLYLSLCILACGLAKNGTQLIIFRGLQGVAASCCLPTAISILTETFPQGRQRTRGLALQGAAQPVGYSVGLFLGGLFVDTIGWRWGWYIASALSVLVFIAGFWSIPHGRTTRSAISWRHVMVTVDWMGALIASACLGLLSYVLAVTASKRSNITHVQNIVFLCIAGLLIPSFYFWMNFQEKRGKPALIPNSVWRSRAFTSICIMMFLASAVLNGGEYFFSLFFQKVQNLSALQASLRFLPNVIVGTCISFGTDATLHKWSTYVYVNIMGGVFAISPIFMALMKPQWPYWYMAFWGMFMLPFAYDVLFIVGAVIITNNFSSSKQALAGSILNTVSQFGSAVGLAVMGVISTSVTDASGYADKNSPDALLKGYRAAFWTGLGCSITYFFIGLFGLRGIGKVGLKQE